MPVSVSVCASADPWRGLVNSPHTPARRPIHTWQVRLGEIANAAEAERELSSLRSRGQASGVSEPEPDGDSDEDDEDDGGE